MTCLCLPIPYSSSTPKPTPASGTLYYSSLVPQSSSPTLPMPGSISSNANATPGHSLQSRLSRNIEYTTLVIFSIPLNYCTLSLYYSFHVCSVFYCISFLSPLDYKLHKDRQIYSFTLYSQLSMPGIKQASNKDTWIYFPFTFIMYAVISKNHQDYGQKRIGYLSEKEKINGYVSHVCGFKFKEKHVQGQFSPSCL